MYLVNSLPSGGKNVWNPRIPRTTPPVSLFLTPPYEDYGHALHIDNLFALLLVDFPFLPTSSFHSLLLLHCR